MCHRRSQRRETNWSPFRFSIAGSSHSSMRGSLQSYHCAPPPKCSDTNLVTVPCNGLNDYIRDCGVICPSGIRLLGRGGCTDWQVDSNYQISSISFGRGLGFEDQTCASAMVSVNWILQSASSVIDYQPTACCAKECGDEVAEVTRQLEAHEAEHRTNCEAAVAEANRVWAARRITACGSDRSSARKRLNLQFAAARQTTQESIAAECHREPAQPRKIDCAKCIPSKAGQKCVNGVCMEERCTQSSRCPQLVDCSQRGKLCHCTQSTEGDIRCAGRVVCSTATPCVTSDGCERFMGPGWFCEYPGTGCCGCATLPNGVTTCGDTGVCVPPC